MAGSLTQSQGGGKPGKCMNPFFDFSHYHLNGHDYK